MRRKTGISVFKPSIVAILNDCNERVSISRAASPNVVDVAKVNVDVEVQESAALGNHIQISPIADSAAITGLEI